MAANLKNAKYPSQKGLSEAKLKEIKYIERYLKNYVEVNGKFENTLINSKKYKKPDFETRMLMLTIDFIKEEEFTLDELYYIFFYEKFFAINDYEFLEKQKNKSFEIIRNVEGYDKEDFARIKSKIETMNPILYGLTQYLVCISYIFYDDENNDEIRPEIFKDSYKNQAS